MGRRLVTPSQRSADAQAVGPRRLHRLWMLADPIVGFVSDPFHSFGFRPEIVDESNNAVRPLSLHKIAAAVLVGARRKRWFRVFGHCGIMSPWSASGQVRSRLCRTATKSSNEAQATAHPPMTTPSDPPDESERRAQDCRAKAAYCKWVAQREPDENLRKFYAMLSVEWEKEATK